MDQYEYIRIANRVYGKNIAEIIKETGHDRKTIKKVLNDEIQVIEKGSGSHIL